MSGRSGIRAGRPTGIQKGVAKMKTGWRKKLAMAGLAGAIAMGSSAVHAEGLMDQATGDGLNVAFYNFKPYAYTDESGVLTGTDVDTLKAVLERLGGGIADAKAIEWGALIPGVKSERFDVVAAGMFVTPKRCAEVRFSEPTFGIQQSLIVMKGNPHGVTDYDSIAEMGLTVAVISGAAQATYARDSGVEEANIMQIPDNPTAIAALRADRAQVYALSVPGSREVVNGVPEQDLEMVPAFNMVAGKVAMPHGAFAFRKGDGDFVDAFNEELTAFVGSPEHLAIFEKHGMMADELPSQSTSELCEG